MPLLFLDALGARAGGAAVRWIGVAIMLTVGSFYVRITPDVVVAACVVSYVVDSLIPNPRTGRVRESVGTKEEG